jgi:hypothetical protein
MALRIQYVGHRNTLFSLEEAAFTQDNLPAGRTNDTLSASMPKGVLGGSVAGLKGDLLVGACARADRPLGLFINNAAGNPFENTPAVASEKGPFVHCLGACQVDVYETHDDDGEGAALEYEAGDLLYSSANGLLTKESSVGQAAVGVVVKAPSASDPWLGLLLLV